MATSMTSTVAHTRIPFQLPPVPRVRPPPIPKGTPGPNTFPVPDGERPGRAVWADGKWRNPKSSSVLHKRKIVSRQLEKALQYEVHGMNIFAYKHFNTGSVVYSLTNHLEETKILKQLLFHGKKTVAAKLRPDEWHPYFSVHFPHTPAGAEAGLRVYQDLRELSMKRQLDPPLYLTHELRRQLVQWNEKIPGPDGKLKRQRRKKTMTIVCGPLPQSEKAKKLMNHRASAVADLAAALKRQAEARLVTPLQQKMIAEKDLAIRDEQLSSRAASRLTQIRSQERSKEEEIQKRAASLIHREDHVPLDHKSVAQIRMEYHGQHSEVLGMHKLARESSEKERQAVQAYQRALALHEQQKNDALQSIESKMMAEIDQELASLPVAQQDDIRTEIDAKRNQLQPQLELEIASLREKHQQQRQKMRSTFPKTPRKAQLVGTHRMKQQHALQMRQKRTEVEQRLKFIGPYEKVYSAMLEKEKAMNEAWNTQAEELQRAIAEEVDSYTDPEHNVIIVNWANVGDGLHATSWPEQVQHGVLAHKAVFKYKGYQSSVHNFAYTLPSAPEDLKAKQQQYTHASEASKDADKRRAKLVRKELIQAGVLREEDLVEEEATEKGREDGVQIVTPEPTGLMARLRGMFRRKSAG